MGIKNDWTKLLDTYVLNIEKLEAKNAELVIKLESQTDELAELRIEFKQLENGHLELGVKLADANSEIGRLGMVIKRQDKDNETMVDSPKTDVSTFSTGV